MQKAQSSASCRKAQRLPALAIHFLGFFPETGNHIPPFRPFLAFSQKMGIARGINYSGFFLYSVNNSSAIFLASSVKYFCQTPGSNLISIRGKSLTSVASKNLAPSCSRSICWSNFAFTWLIRYSIVHTINLQASHFLFALNS